MEFTLHRQLKALAAGEDSPQEVRVGRFRADAWVDGRVIEVQVSSLAALARKLEALLAEHPVRVIKPVVARKTIVRSGTKGREKRRRSPKRGGWVDLFDELVYLTRVLPHPRLEVQALLIEVEEWRRPKPAAECRWKRRDFRIDDVRLVEVIDERWLAGPADLWKLLPAAPPARFDTADLAACCGVARWRAQRIAYTLAKSGAAQAVGKRGRCQLYERAAPEKRVTRRRTKRPKAA